jgi:antitoxin CcdA
MRRRTSETKTTRATNVSVRHDLLAAAREAGIDLSATLEKALFEELAAAKHNKWCKDNREAIDAYNEHVARHGAFSDGVRFF